MSQIGVKRGRYKVKTYKQMRTTKAKHIMPNGDIVKATQDIKDHTLWHLEIFKDGEQANCLTIEITGDNCYRLFKLLERWQPKPSKAKNHGGNSTYYKYYSSEAPMYTLKPRIRP